VFTGGPPILVYGAALVDAVAASLARPARATIIPRLARTPAELVTSNVALTAVRSLALLVGPAGAAFLLATDGVAATLGAAAVLMAFAWLTARTLHPAAPLTVHGGGPHPPQVVAGQLARQMVVPRTLVVVIASHQLLRGLLTVLVVVLAVELLGGGAESVGALNAAVGIGAVIGAVVYALLARQRRLSPALAAAGILMGVAAASAGAIPSFVGAAAVLGVYGAGRATAEVAGVTLLQRTVPAQQRGGVFAITEAIGNLAFAMGSLAAAALVAVVGKEPTFVIAGVLTAAASALAWQVIRRADDHTVVPIELLHLLRRVPMFRPLALVTVEELAMAAEREEVPADTVVVRQGEPGETFYIIESGVLAVSIDGIHVRDLGPGDSFGEIALIRDVRRTASVEARTPAVLVELHREPFLAAVAGRLEASAAAESVVRERLGA